MMRRLTIALVLLFACGCSGVRDVLQYVVMPEQRSVDMINPDRLPSVPIRPIPPPRTVSNPRPETRDWNMSLDEAIRIALENAKAIRVLTGATVTASGQTIYDAAITNTTIDQQQATFDPVLKENNMFGYTNTPLGQPNITLASITTGVAPNPPTILLSQPYDQVQSVFGLTKTNVLGGQVGVNWTENFQKFYNFNPSINPFAAEGYPLNPEQTGTMQISYTQPFLQGAGFRVNMAPIVIARLNTQVSFYQYKDSVQELVRSVADAYWQLVQNRTAAWARKIQVDQSKEAWEREAARLKIGLGDKSNEAQAKATYLQFRANLVAADAAVLSSEGTLRNLLGLPPDDDRRIVPTSLPTSQRYKSDWESLIRLAEKRRPDIIQLKLTIEAEKQRLIQAENNMLPQLNGVAQYQWNSLSGTMPNGVGTATIPGEFTDWSLAFNFSMPLSLRQARAQVRQEKMTIAKEEANLEQGIHAAIHEIAASLRNLDSAYEQYVAFKESRMAAEANVRVQNEKFKAGQTIYLNVLQALNDWGNAIMSESQSLLSYNTLLATLERQTGTILETHGLVFQEERMKSAGPCLFPREYTIANPPFDPAGPRLGFETDEASENFFDLRSPTDDKGKNGK